jgi:hypothetical protein
MIAQDNKSKENPQRVIAAFSKKYPNTRVKKWEAEKDGYRAKFIAGEKKMFAFYFADGNWKMTWTKLKWIKDLPESIMVSLKENGYAGWRVVEMREIETQHGHEFEIHIDNGNLLDADHYAFKDDYLLLFTVDGKLYKKEKLP